MTFDQPAPEKRHCPFDRTNPRMMLANSNGQKGSFPGNFDHLTNHQFTRANRAASALKSPGLCLLGDEHHQRVGRRGQHDCF